MITANGIEVTLVGADWQVGWPDGYRLVFRDLDVSRPRVFAAETVAYYGDKKLLAQTIDALRSHDRPRVSGGPGRRQWLTPRQLG